MQGAPRLDCDFCLGTAERNKVCYREYRFCICGHEHMFGWHQDGVREDMVSCGACGHSGHPSCLQFSSELTATVKTYAWLCLECKGCTVCQRTDDEVRATAASGALCRPATLMNNSCPLSTGQSAVLRRV